MAVRAPAAQRQLRRPGLLVRTLRALTRLVSLLFLALIFSILMEWAGMTFWWPEQGVRHSERMLAQELSYLNEDFKKAVLRSTPAQFGHGAAAWTQGMMEAAGLTHLIEWLNRPSGRSANWQTELHEALRFAGDYLEATVNVAQTFAVRMTVLLLATPVFALFGLVGLAEGLMRRDLRRWGGGRESSFVYHHSRKVLGASLLSAWMLYLAAPFTVHPNLILLPFAALFAIGVAVTMATFKKYL